MKRMSTLVRAYLWCKQKRIEFFIYRTAPIIVRLNDDHPELVPSPLGARELEMIEFLEDAMKTLASYMSDEEKLATGDPLMWAEIILARKTGIRREDRAHE